MLRHVSMGVSLALVAGLALWWFQATPRAIQAPRAEPPHSSAIQPRTPLALTAPTTPPNADALPAQSLGSTKRAPSHDDSASISGRLMPAPGVVLAAHEAFAGNWIEWERTHPVLTPRFDARGEPIAPLETFGDGGQVELRDDGTFELVDLPIGVELVLSMWGALGEAEELVCAPLQAGERRSVELALLRGERASRRVQGVVVDESGRPLFAPVFLAYWGSDSDELREHTSMDGRFEFDIEPGLCRVWVEAEASGRRPFLLGDSIDVDARERDPDPITLRTTLGTTLEGRVRWPDGSPVLDFYCTFEGLSGEAGGGRFRIEHVPARPGELRIETTGEARVGWLATTVTPGASAPLHVLEVIEPCELTLSAVDKNGRALTVHAEVDSDGWQAPSFCEIGPARRPGPVALTVAPGAHVVRVSAHGYLQQERKILVERSMALEFVLEEAGLLRGRVVDESGVPVPDADVGLARAGFFSATDEQGHFELRPRVERGQVLAFADGFAPSAQIPFELASGAVREGLTLILRPSCTLELGLTGVRTEGELRLETGGDAEDVSFDRSGRLVLTGLPPGPGSATVLFPDGSLGARADFVLVPGRRTRVELAASPPR